MVAREIELKCFIGEPAFLYTESAFKGRVSTKRSIAVRGTEVSLLWFKTEDISAAMRARTSASGGRRFRMAGEGCTSDLVVTEIPQPFGQNFVDQCLLDWEMA